MIAQELHPRIIENKDWATALFILSIALVVVAKSLFENRFNDFVRLIVSDKYFKIYKESNHLLSGFNVLLFLVNLISLSFFIELALCAFLNLPKTDWILFVQIFTGLTVFILSKFLIEKIIANIFNVEELVELFNLQKVNFRTYLGLLLLPITVVLYYGNFATKTLFIVIISILLFVNLLTYFFSLKIYQNILFSKLFYFILYLCALEIAPYYFIYYLIRKN
ncbi:DUF4271 domain-containing protein [Flavobacterium sp. SUN046]|uniref:DUF4271 domain-containing protein n=1 Tax=Flavobacterium sp. SUN046 TaxID=3002440 RepID=UPI002DBF3016|nr:DUF4271 domain-containing protein [Flavobacterium sp. SUN046]MEC4049971.1 DUF4271 domain-containing protein [Flavobacterium sp. SUN046]